MTTHETDGPDAAPAQPPVEDVQECEWQFDAVHTRPVLQWLHRQPFLPRARVSDVEEKNLRDVYCDTEDWRVFRAGFALRIREKGGAVECTLKELEGGDDALRRRREISQPLDGQDVDSLLSASGPVAERVRDVAGSREVRPFLRIDTRRQVMQLDAEADGGAEIALDETSISMDGDAPPAHLSRVEVEVKRGEPSALQPIVEALRRECNLRATTVSKLETGLLAHGLTPGGEPDLGPTEAHPAMTVAELGYAVLRRHLGVMLRNESGTRLGDDIEALHDMRVATRRMRAALRLFGAYLPARFRSVNNDLRWVGRALGEVRDLDVQLEQMDEWSSGDRLLDPAGMEQLTGMIESRRRVARRRMLRALDTRRYERFVGSFAELLRRGPSRRWRTGRVPALAVAPDLVERAHRKVRKPGDRIGPDSPPADYHALRIRCKRLRYALEFTRGLYGKPARSYIRRTVGLQDLLGLHQDSDVAVAHFRELLDARGRKLKPETIYNIGQLAEYHRRRAAKLRRRFPGIYRRLVGKPWTTLKAIMEAHRPAPPPTDL
jgi:CHAD domain-containing protein